MPATTPDAPTPRLHPAAAPLLLAGVLLAAAALGHDGRRVAQLAALALPLVLWVAWPLRSQLLHRVRGLLVGVLALGFVLDGSLRHYLWERYQAAPDSSMVLGALANAHADESWQYLLSHWPDVLMRLAPALLGALAVAWAVQHAARRPLGALAWRPPRRAAMATVALLLLVSGVAHASKPWRRLHPALFWPQWVESAQQLRAGWAAQLQAREHTLAQARALAPEPAFDGPATVMLVVGESINRDNLGLYGYPRDTTPRLDAERRRLGDALLVLNPAWSVEASTLPSLQRLFRFGAADGGDAPHLLALARAAGYKVWWIGNQDDMALRALHAGLADAHEIVNRRPGRSGATLDGELLDEVHAALADPAPRKLLVVHLIGAHPHYGLRRPAGAHPFEADGDAVDQALARAGRSAWTREARQDYDAALRYHDGVLADLLQALREGDAPGERSAWMYLSDHGQEVGHELDRAGHSATTEAGYRIPALIWRDEALADAALAARPFRADWAAWTVAGLLGVRWPGHDASRDVLSPDYRWQPPRLPIATASPAR